MPELPEVETIARQLHTGLKGKRIEKVIILKTGRETPAGKSFSKKVRDLKFKEVRRRAKVLVFVFDGGLVMLAHLKMTGKFLFANKKYSPTKHDRILFVFKGGAQLVWSDVRQFGYVKLVKVEDLPLHLGHYGPEPLQISPKELAERLNLPSKRTIKAILLDQTVIAGVGNIYADEACFRAGIRPMRRLSSLTTSDRLRLVKELVKVLNLSVKRRGTTADDYLDAKGQKGSFQKLLKVYGRGNQVCFKCDSFIKKIVLGGRGTHYCPSCQR